MDFKDQYFCVNVDGFIKINNYMYIKSSINCEWDCNRKRILRPDAIFRGSRTLMTLTTRVQPVDKDLIFL